MLILIPSQADNWEEALIVRIKKNKNTDLLIVPSPEPKLSKRAPLLRYLNMSGFNHESSMDTYRIDKFRAPQAQVISIRTFADTVWTEEEKIPVFCENDRQELQSIAESLKQCNDIDSLILFMQMALPYVMVNEEAIWNLYEIFCRRFYKARRNNSYI